MMPLAVLVGTTASGKSEVSIPLARVLDAEIVSLDSMLLYRGMDIGTDKPSDLGGVPHHGIDVLDPKDRFDLKRYLSLADEAIAGIAARGRRALVVGGTGLYLMGLFKGVFSGPARDPELRASLEGVESEVLHARLAGLDPETAAVLHPRDRRRIVRAIEVFTTTGTSLRTLQTQFSGPDRYEAVVAGIRRPQEDLRARVEARVEAMFGAGLVEEVARLDLGPTASQAVGYKEVQGALAGDYDLAEARRRIVRNTLRLARRQRTWLKRFPVTWIDAGPHEPVSSLVDRLGAVYLGTTTE